MRGIIEFENGALGKISIGGTKTVNLSFFEILVNGRKFVCNDRSRTSFEEWLSHLPEDVIDLTFLYSINPDCLNDEKSKSVRCDKKRPKLKTVCYNCTVKVSKNETRIFFEDKRQRLKDVVNILSRVYMRRLRKSETDKSDAYQFSGK